MGCETEGGKFLNSNGLTFSEPNLQIKLPYVEMRQQEVSLCEFPIIHITQAMSI